MTKYVRCHWDAMLQICTAVICPEPWSSKTDKFSEKFQRVGGGIYFIFPCRCWYSKLILLSIRRHFKDIPANISEIHPFWRSKASLINESVVAQVGVSHFLDLGGGYTIQGVVMGIGYIVQGWQAHFFCWRCVLKSDIIISNMKRLVIW